MKDRRRSFIPAFLKPYIFIGITGVLAFAPVSFMLRSMKNDLVALEYPINYFMSQCIHHGELPYWFNTWGMGFPLQSNLTWGIFSTPQMIFCSIFNYDIHALHIEYVFFVMLAGWSMYYLLKKHFLITGKLAIVLSCCYMLSGFLTGSGQWLLYVTAVALIPIVLHGILQLLKQPSFKHAIIFAAFFYLLFTSVYAAFSIISSYVLVIFLICYLLNPAISRAHRLKALKFLAFAGAIIAVLCLPCLLSTIEVLKHLSRGNPISENTGFFNSNYVPAAGLRTLLLPFSSVRMNYLDTEGTMIDSYIGLFTAVLLPVAAIRAFRKRNKIALLLFGTAVIFFLISMGPVLPLRSALNWLPGFSYFRNAGIFRSYFIFFIILFLVYSFKNQSWHTVFNWESASIKITFLILIFLCLLTIALNLGSFRQTSFTSISTIIKDLSFSQVLLISAFIQLTFLIILFYCFRQRWFRLMQLFCIFDLVINVLLCAPYFIVSSYSPAQVNSILYSVNGFPAQKISPAIAPATHTDEHGNVWNNVNVFSKQVSLNETYRGPLTLNNVPDLLSEFPPIYQVKNLPFAFLRSDTSDKVITLQMQRPTHVQLKVNAAGTAPHGPDSLTILQNYFRGWRAFYNNSEIQISKNTGPGMTIAIPAGNGTIDFRYERKDIWIPALILHALMLSFFAWRFWDLFKRRNRLIAV